MLYEFILGAHLATYHFNREKNYNEFNPGLYASVQKDDWDCNPTSGFFKNSFSRQSIWLGCTFHLTKEKDWRLIIGGATGYKNVKPMYLVQYNKKITNSMFGGVTFMPPADTSGSAGLHLTVEYKFSN